MVNVRSKIGRSFRFCLTSVLSVILVFALVLTPVAQAEGSSMELKASVEGMDVTVKAFHDEANSILALLGAMGTGDEVMLDAGLYLTAESLILESASVLGQAYGVDLTHYAENLAASVFAPDSGSSFALDEETYAMLQGDLESAITTNVGNGDLDSLRVLADSLAVPAEELVNALQVPINNVMETLTDSMEVSMKPITLTLPTGDVDASLMSVTFGTEALCKAVCQYSADVQQCEEAKAPMAQILNAMKEAGVLELTEEQQDMTGEELAAISWEELPAVTERVITAMTDANVRLVFSAATDKATEEMVAVAAELNANGETASVEVYFVGGAYGLEIYLPDEDPVLVWFVLPESDEGFEAVFLLQVGETAAAYADFWLEADGYTVTYGGAESETVLAGRILEEDGNLVITLDTVNGEAAGDISLTLRDSDSVAVPEFTEILTLSEEEVAQLVQTISQIAESLSAA